MSGAVFLLPAGRVAQRSPKARSQSQYSIPVVNGRTRGVLGRVPFSPVMQIDKCPDRSDIALMRTPDSGHPVAAEWRAVCTPTSLRATAMTSAPYSSGNGVGAKLICPARRMPTDQESTELG